MTKKLKVEDIPEGYNYAAVDYDGYGVAYKYKPFLADGDIEWSCSSVAFKKIGQFEASNWEDSLVSREAAERPQPKKLTAADIPEGYNFAAIDRDGQTYVYTQKPTLGDANWISLGGNFKFFSLQFDASDWKNSLVSRETSERIKRKKLTTADIPEGYNYAAVDEDGEAFAYQEYPVIIVTCWKGTCRNPKFLGNNFDASDWENSLVSREAAQPETAYKETANKLSYSEIDPYFLEQMARRMQKGKEKYGPNNWKKLSDINELLDAAQRHLIELRKMVEEDFEPLPGQESEAQHCAALACNAMFMHYHLNPNS